MCDIVCGDLVSAGVERFQSSYLHSYVLSHLFNFVIYHVGNNVNQNTDLSASVNVGSNETVLLFHLLETTDLQVLADNSDLSCQFLSYSLARIQVPFLSQESVDVGCLGGQSLICNSLLHSYGISRSLQRSRSQS